MGQSSLHQEIHSILGMSPTRVASLSGGCVGEVYRIWLPDGRSLVAKVATGQQAALSIEGYMLTYLAEHSTLPVPAVHFASDTVLLMEFCDGESHFSPSAERHAAELLAELHSVRADHFGLERDTLIGGLHQPNGRLDSWLDFFRERRLLAMGREALDSGRLSSALFKRIERFAAHLDDFLDEPEHPSLIHGDAWTTNILATGGRISGFIDPAIYYAHPEIELAFTTLFGTFSRNFFDHYHELRPIRPGFFEVRRDIYNLYPLLVHVRLFGGGYATSIDRTLHRLNF